MVSGALVPRAGGPSAAPAPRPVAARNAAPRRLLGDLSRSAQRRRQRHGRGLRRPALAWAFATTSPRWSARDWIAVQGRLAQYPRLHPLLARADRRMALGEDAQPAAGSDLVAALVPVQHLQFRAMGARHPFAPLRRSPRAGQPAAAAATGSPRCFRRARQLRLRPPHKGRTPAAGTGSFAGPTRSCMRLQKLGAQAHRPGRGAAVLMRRMDRAPPGRRRRLGRHPAALDLWPHGAAQRGLRARPIRCSPKASTRSTIPSGAWDEGEATFIQAHQLARSGTRCSPCSPSSDAGLSDEYPDQIEKAAEWLLVAAGEREGRLGVKLPDVEPGGWAFEYANIRYPDIDDTAVALIALAPFRDHPKFQAHGHRRGHRARRGLAASPCRARAAAGAPSTRTTTRKS